MIDPHDHFRDWKQKHKETLEHGLMMAYLAGLDAVFEMPNTDPALTSSDRIKERIDWADKAIDKLGINIFHGVYAGITADPDQIADVVKAWKELFPRVVGLKMFAGHSTGNMGIIDPEEQRFVYQVLMRKGFDGVLAVHCEKESYMKPGIWDPNKPFTHTRARPPKSEVRSVQDQIRFMNETGFYGTLHIPHISVPGAVDLVKRKEGCSDYASITCGATPHHLMMYDEMMDNGNGIFLKMNPPLRKERSQKKLLECLVN